LKSLSGLTVRLSTCVILCRQESFTATIIGTIPVKSSECCCSSSERSLNGFRSSRWALSAPVENSPKTPAQNSPVAPVEISPGVADHRAKSVSGRPSWACALRKEPDAHTGGFYERARSETAGVERIGHRCTTQPGSQNRPEISAGPSASL